jgi:hypothetical protein
MSGKNIQLHSQTGRIRNRPGRQVTLPDNVWDALARMAKRRGPLSSRSMVICELVENSPEYHLTK